MATLFGTNGNNTLIVESDDLRGLAGNDTYIVTNNLANDPANANRTIVITDTEGDNRLQLADGLQISRVDFLGGNAVQITLSNNARIQVVGADRFTFDIGGNAAAGDALGLIGRTYAQLASAFGVTLNNGAGSTSGPVTIQPGANPVGSPAPPPPAALPVVSIEPLATPAAEGNSGATAYTFTVSRTGDTTGASTVNYAVTGSGANPVNASDFVGGVLPSGTVSFAAGQTSQVVTVNVAGDTVVETDETFTISLSGPTGATLGTSAVTRAVVNDDVAPPPPPPVVAIEALATPAAEGNSGATAYTFTVSRTGDTTGASTVNYAVTGSGANPVNASDFVGGVLPSGTVSFAAGQTSQVVTVNVAGDTVVETDETFTISLSGPTGATLGTSAVTRAVVNDDVAPPINVGTPTPAPTIRTSVASEAPVNTNFNDPLFGSQWNLVNTGQRYANDPEDAVNGKTALQKIAEAQAKNGGMLLDINVMDAWKTGYTGKGIIQSVSDDGFDLAHEDIQNNLLPNLAYNGATNAQAAMGAFSDRQNFSQPTENNQPKVVNGVTLQRGDESHQHGTVVGSIAANEANNGKGIVGIAFDSKLIPAVILETSPAANTATHLAYLRANNVAVSLNSYGADPAFSENYGDYNGNLLTATGTQAPGQNEPQQSNLNLGQEIRLAAQQGRGGLGMVLEFSAGNERTTKADSALTNGTGSRYVIAVGSVDEVGNVASYGSRGTNILVSAFGGGGQGEQTVNAGFGVVAGDNKNQLNTGYNNVDITPTDNIDQTAYSFFNTGTSYSGPTVGGVAALMLQANPNLGFRDVSTILALTARKVGDQATNLYVTNGATNWNLGGMHHSDEGVGYGLVDATAAVRLAEQWTQTAGTAANWKSLSGSQVVQNPLAIPDNDKTNGLTVTASVATPSNAADLISIERVEFELDLGASKPQELRAVVTSPSGTQVTLFIEPRADGAWPGVFSIGSSAFLGEKADGNWTLKLYDMVTGTMADATFKSFKVNAWGSAASSDSQYYFTREYNATDKSITDTAGIDTINASAVHKAVTLNLVAGQTNSIGNDTATPGAFTIASGSVIENAIGGGGNDSITGNTANNVLRGSWGNDTINGGDGNDTLVGGIGKDSLTGGAGSDMFVITELDATAATISFLGDTITDFVSGTDKLQLDVTALSRLAGTWTGNTAGLTGYAGAQGANFLVLGTAATAAYAQLLYSGEELKVDIDGTGSATAVTLATLVGVAQLSVGDFMFTGAAMAV